MYLIKDSLLQKELLKKYRNPKKRKLVKTKSEPVKKPDNPFIETPSANIEISLVLENLEKNFGYVQAVKNLNLTLYKYEIVVLLGFAESGKTTTLSIITGKYIFLRIIFYLLFEVSDSFKLILPMKYSKYLILI